MTNDKKKVYSNLSPGEKSALKNLIELQKNCDIVIQRADKGGALTIMNRQDYIDAVTNEHLTSSVTKQDGTTLPVYREIDPVMIKVHHEIIRCYLEDAVVDKIIDKKLADQLLPDQPAEGRAYAMPKCHKDVQEGKVLPPTRLVISGCGSNTENISHYVNVKTKKPS